MVHLNLTIFNQIDEEAKEESVLHQSFRRETPHRYYQQSEFIELMHNQK